jgi:NADPH2:quinone reductase
MRAARITTWATDPVLEDVPAPQRRAGQTIVALEAAALSHLDLTVASGDFGLKPDLPYTGGTEGCGRVLESDVWQPGAQVLVRGAGAGIVKDGCWAEQVVVADKGIHALDVELPAPLAASFFQPCGTAHVAVHDVGQIQPGQRVFIRGAAGAVGSVAVQVARRAGAEVTAIVSRPERTAQVPGDVRVVVADQLDAEADVLVDTVGGAGLAAVLKRIRQGGRAVLIGYTGGTELTLDLPSWLLQDIALLPVNMIRQDARARELAPSYARLLAGGEIVLPVQEYALDDIKRGLDDLRNGRISGRAIVTME